MTGHRPPLLASLALLCLIAWPTALTAQQPPPSPTNGPLTPKRIVENDIRLTAFAATHAQALSISVSTYDESTRPLAQTDEALEWRRLTIETRPTTWQKLEQMLVRIAESDELVGIQAVEIRRSPGSDAYRASLELWTLEFESNADANLLSNLSLQTLPVDPAGYIARRLHQNVVQTAQRIDQLEVDTDRGTVRLSGRARSVDAARAVGEALESTPCVTDPRRPELTVVDEGADFRFLAIVRCPPTPQQYAASLAAARARLADAIPVQFGADQPAIGPKAVRRAAHSAARDLRLHLLDRRAETDEPTWSLSDEKWFLRGHTLYLDNWSIPALARFLRRIRTGDIPLLIRRVTLQPARPARVELAFPVTDVDAPGEAPRWRSLTTMADRMVGLLPSQSADLPWGRARLDAAAGHVLLEGVVPDFDALERLLRRLRRRDCTDRVDIQQVWRRRADRNDYTLQLTGDCPIR